MKFEKKNMEDLIKRKGRYEYKRQAHQNISKLIVPIAAEAYFIRNIPVEETILNHYKKSYDSNKNDPKFDFMICTKIPRSSRLVTKKVKIEGYDYSLKNGYDKLPGLKEFQSNGFNEKIETLELSETNTYNKIVQFLDEEEQNRVARYHVSSDQSDPFLIKIMPPLESKLENGERLFNLEAGYHVNICTNAKNFNWDTLNYEYYIREAEKLIDLQEISFDQLPLPIERFTTQ